MYIAKNSFKMNIFKNLSFYPYKDSNNENDLFFLNNFPHMWTVYRYIKKPPVHRWWLSFYLFC